MQQRRANTGWSRPPREIIGGVAEVLVFGGFLWEIYRRRRVGPPKGDAGVMVADVEESVR
ncbi:hypothetical protein HRbin10_00686 [bacterium HR10]|nr:hypothetical protein HRbin10_00686 [bacterium HR10]